MVSQSDLIENFALFGNTGKAQNMEVTEADDGAAFLWGYGWALYAYREPQGRLYVYDGWEGYSSETTKHIRYFKHEHDGYGDYAIEAATERVEEYVDATPSKEGSIGFRHFDADGCEELEKYGDDILP